MYRLDANMELRYAWAYVIKTCMLLYARNRVVEGDLAGRINSGLEIEKNVEIGIAKL